MPIQNIGILITDHNVEETLSITDRAYLMVDGKLFKQGTAEDLASDAMVRKVYLGQNFQLRRARVDTNLDDSHMGVTGEPDEPDLFTETPLDSPPDQTPPAL